MRVTITIDTDVINGCRFDVFEDTKYTIRENMERPIEVFEALDKWTTSKISGELKSIRKAPSWEVI